MVLHRRQIVHAEVLAISIHVPLIFVVHIIILVTIIIVAMLIIFIGPVMQIVIILRI